MPTRAEQRVIRRRAACDECRLRKLKCSGGQPSCSRCGLDGKNCIYTPQKPMGRPKKRQRGEETGGMVMVVEGNDSVEQQPYGIASYEILATFGLPANDKSAGLNAIGSHDALIPETAVQSMELQQVPSRNHHDSGSSSETAVPSLTTDSASPSSPGLNLLPEVTTIDSDRHDRNAAVLIPGINDIQLPHNRSLDDGASTDSAPSALTQCACLSTMYLTLNSLQTMDTNVQFTSAMHALREAMQSAAEVLACGYCPTRFITGLQNVHLMGTLLASIAESSQKILDSIKSEAERAERAGEVKHFGLNDLKSSTSYMHTNDLGCDSASKWVLSPDDWHSMSKMVVRKEVYGPAFGNARRPYLQGLCKAMEERQKQWHQRVPPADFPRDSSGELIGREKFIQDFASGETPLCMRLVSRVNAMIDAFDWS